MSDRPDISYQEALSFIHSNMRFGARPGLERIRSLLDLLGNPQDTPSFIHVAGTNGKGSVTAMISSILHASGYRTGQYISPYLEDFRERIQVNGKLISEEELVCLTRTVREKMSVLSSSGVEALTEFEVVTAIGLSHFDSRECDYVALEVGLGGRYDPTNVVTPLVSVITTISLDHTERLGDTLYKIAFEKAGIIKPGVPVVTGAVQEEPLRVISRVASDLCAPLIVVGKEDGCHVTWREVDYTPDGQTIDIAGPSYCYRGLSLSLAGRHQQQNAAMAVAAIMNSGIPVDEQAVRAGLMTTIWPGRLETLSRNPRVLLDGAHNPAAARVVRQYLQGLPRRRLIAVLGVLGDKSYGEIADALAPESDRVVCTRPKTPRALEPSVLADEVRKHCDRVTIIDPIEAALDAALDSADPEDVILIAGSLYLVGPARTYLRHRLGISANRAE